MARYIDADMLMSEFEDLMKDDNVMCPVIKVLDVFPIIDNIPTVDVVEVVRCKECIHLYKEKMLCTCEHNRIFNTSKPTFSNCFCSYGERRGKQ